MILLDFNQIAISSIVTQISTDSSSDVTEDLIRHVVISTILRYKRKFTDEFGEVVICADDRNYWRKDIFPYYKAQRKQWREKSDLDWGLIFDILHKVRDEIRDHFNYKVLKIEKAEADDVIASMCMYTAGSPEKMIIVSADKDFMQLQCFPNVKQYSPYAKKYIKTDNPSKFLKEHIIRGDSGDGIPNFLSQDDILMTPGKKQKSVYSKKLNDWLRQRPEDFCDEVMLRNYKRNERLIDLQKIPEQLKERVVYEFENYKLPKTKSIYQYLVEKKLTRLMEDINEF